MTNLNVWEVLKSPVITEKSVLAKENAANEDAGQVLTFRVNTKAGKEDVRKAVEEIFNVKVDKVAVQNRIGKMRRSRTRQTSTKAWKKAVVKLKPDFKINLF